MAAEIKPPKRHLTVFQGFSSVSAKLSLYSDQQIKMIYFQYSGKRLGHMVSELLFAKQN